MRPFGASSPTGRSIKSLVRRASTAVNERGGSGSAESASLGIDLQVKPDYGSPSSSFVASNVPEKKKDSLLLFSLAIPQMPPA
ncbi:hypothetical protein G5I_04733 [Acromyrmex echinatior]|uniref:Uncharacterized protein n=1 Tax=Acromyrmex echinatior TaxID=103372 RepID=F4WGF8_ACREC|nr:hypothetical protein G5I_04733 [Acromyrmex echinatior]